MYNHKKVIYIVSCVLVTVFGLFLANSIYASTLIAEYNKTITIQEQQIDQLKTSNSYWGMAYADMEKQVQKLQQEIDEEIANRLKVEAKYNMNSDDIDTTQRAIIKGDKNYEYLCRCVESEASTGTFEEKTYIASVILNRVDYTGFGSTIYGVVTAPGQFNYSRTYISEQTRQAVDFVLDYGDTAQGAIYFKRGDKVDIYYGRPWLFTDDAGIHYY